MERYRYPPEAVAALESLGQPFAVYQYIDHQVVTLLVSDGFCELFGFPGHSEAMGAMDHDMYHSTHPDDRVRLSDAAARFIGGDDDSRLDIVYRTRSGVSSDYRVIHLRGKHIRTETGIRLAHVWYMEEGMYIEGDESAGTRLNLMLNSALHENSILKATHFDNLTGLPNLAYYFKLCEAEKSRLLSEGKQCALLYMDLNGMKYFNHRNSFTEGDKLLKAFAAVLVQVFGRENCCHVSADRFAASTAMDNLDASLRALFDAARRMNGGKTLPVRVGIYCGDLEDVPVSTAYDRAKMACDAIRKSGSSVSNRYSYDLQEADRRHQYLVANFDRAISEKWIKVYYQPIVRATSQKICDEEALARWIDPVEGIMPPEEFIPQLEKAGLVYRLDLYVLEQVLEKMRDMKSEGLHLFPHSINLSRSDFESCDIVEEIRKRVDAAGISRDKITIEITESVIGSNFDFMKEQITRFRSLGFPVWMDDFGSGYSSLDVLQSIRFDLIKFDMSFLRKLDEGNAGKIILTELMKLATFLGVDTVCEGVETMEQVRFLQEIGCSKLQGFFFGKPVPVERIRERYHSGLGIGFEDPAASSYFEAIGRVNLYDLDVIARQDENYFQNAFNTMPMAIIEVKGDRARYIRTNPSYRTFVRRFFNFDMSSLTTNYVQYRSAFMNDFIRTCCEQGIRSFYNEKMPDGSVVHSFSRRISINPVTGDTAVAVGVLSVSDPGDGESYADIARALAADYYNIYVVDLDTDDFIEYSSPIGRDTLAMERHGTDFFAAARRDTMTRIYADDREPFLAWFTRDHVLKELEEHGVVTTSYRLIDTGTPVYAGMKITRLQGTNRIILGISLIDSPMKPPAQT